MLQINPWLALGIRVDGGDGRGVCAVQCGGFGPAAGTSSDLEQHVVFAFGLRGNQLHQKLGVRGFCRCGIVGGGVCLDDLIAQTRRRVRAEECLGQRIH